MDLIERSAAVESLGEEPPVWMGEDYELAERDQWRRDKAAIESVPSAQPEIIYCGECKYMMPDGRCREFADSCIYPSASDFCSRAERKTDG